MKPTPGSRSTQALDALTDIAADFSGASSEELDKELLGFGIDPYGLMDRILTKVKRRTDDDKKRCEATEDPD